MYDVVKMVKKLEHYCQDGGRMCMMLYRQCNEVHDIVEIMKKTCTILSRRWRDVHDVINMKIQLMKLQTVELV